ncbi:integral peroxisomal membrane peroxin [Gigaspora margarita]|uniref:Integral peroxisomal membrane peroxin n=1 Tax=Gigaspora margarita TaxID=4874 RepID=A0A8H3X2A0_GIGMA|nr:integral peroxisomal membrane peroxin [Gigaspora margarita]
MIDSDSNDENNSNESRGHKVTSKRRASSADSLTPQTARPIVSHAKTLDTKIIQDLLVSSVLNVTDSAKMPSDSTHPPLNIKLLSLYPQLLILIPLIGFLAVLIYNFPNDTQIKKKSRIQFKRFTRLNDYLPAENSVDYLKNMQNIQNLMGMISDGYDVAVDLLKHIDWSNERETLLIMQIVIVILTVTSLTVWIVPWKYVFIAGGLGIFIVNTQFVKAVTKEMSPFILGKFNIFTKQFEDYLNSEDFKLSEKNGNDGETAESNLSQDEIDLGVGSSSKT